MKKKYCNCKKNNNKESVENREVVNSDIMCVTDKLATESCCPNGPPRAALARSFHPFLFSLHFSQTIIFIIILLYHIDNSIVKSQSVLNFTDINL